MCRRLLQESFGERFALQLGTFFNFNLSTTPSRLVHRRPSRSSVPTTNSPPSPLTNNNPTTTLLLPTSLSSARFTVNCFLALFNAHHYIHIYHTMPLPQHDNYESQITGVAFSNKTLVIISTIGFASLGILLWFLIIRHAPVAEDEDINYGEVLLDQADVATLSRAERRAWAKLRMKSARRLQTATGRQGGNDGNQGGEMGVLIREDGDNNHNTLSRKERQKAAKALELEERKNSTEMARRRREADAKKKQLGKQGVSVNSTEQHLDTKKDKIRIEELFPRREDDDDSLSEHLFWKSIVERCERDNVGEQLVSSTDAFTKMTIRTFVERLKQHRHVSVSALADEFGIDIPEALAELETLNNQCGVIGVVDGVGNFVYVTKEMVHGAIELGRASGGIACPDY